MTKLKRFWRILRSRLCKHASETTMDLIEGRGEVCMQVFCPKCGLVFFHEHFPGEEVKPKKSKELH